MINDQLATTAFLLQEGEMSERIRQKDWTSTVVGPPATWPQNLRISINILLSSKFPMFIWWGRELITFYNDQYKIIAGEKHPGLLGQSGNIGWAEIWDDLSPLVESVFNGKSTWSEDQMLIINRHGVFEETYFTFSYSPIFSDTGLVEGLFCACIETTDKVIATRKIAESEANLRNTILQAPVAMCILKGSTFKVEIANQRMFELWGRGGAAILNKPIFEGLPEVRQQGLEDILDRVYTTGEPFSAYERPITLPRENGIETFYINFVYSPLCEGDGVVTGVIAVAIDVTQQVLARKVIEESEQELQLRVKERTAELEKQDRLVDNILRNSSNGISVTEMVRDEQGNIVDARTILANDAAVKNTGMDREVYLSKTARDLDPGILDSEYGRACLRTLENGEPFVLQYYLAITGKWLELTVSRMDEDHLIHVFTDVTSIKQTQLQLERKVEELKNSNSNLEQFAYAASHDLKEPIRKISVFANRLKHELLPVLSEPQLLIFNRMENATNRMIVLIEDLLNYSHSAKGLSNLELIDLNAKVRTVLDDLEIAVQEKKAQFHIEKLPTILGNRRQIQQMFHNLFANALKYVRKDVPANIEVTCKEVQGHDTLLKLTGHEGSMRYYQIAVKDNGIGFEQQYANEIFNIFTRLHGVSEYTGSGVGLSIVRRVVDNHKGFIWANGTPGEGATFTLLLPVSDNPN